MRDRLLGGVRLYFQRMLTPAHEIVDPADLEFPIRTTSFFADETRLDRKQVERTALAVVADVYTELTRPEVARLAGLSEEGVRTAVLDALQVDEAEGDEYEKAKSRCRADLWVDDVLEHLAQSADVVRVAVASAQGSRVVRDQLLLRAQELRVRGKVVQEWSGLSESGVSAARRRAKAGRAEAARGDRPADHPGGAGAAD